MIEVEAKIDIRKEDISKIKKRIISLAKYKEKEIKIDYYYAPLSKKYPKKSIRLRILKNKTGKIYQMNTKHYISFKKGVYAKQEIEFPIETPKKFLWLMKELGMKRWIKKQKISYIYEIKKNFHIELNKVKKLGWFIEVEYLCNTSQIRDKRSDVLKIVKQLGFSENDLLEEGYTKMLWNKKKKKA